MAIFDGSGDDSWDKFLQDWAITKQDINGLPGDRLMDESMPSQAVLGGLPPDVQRVLQQNAAGSNTNGLESILGRLPSGIPLLDTPDGPEGTPGADAYLAQNKQAQPTQPTDLMSELGIEGGFNRGLMLLGSTLQGMGAGMRGQQPAVLDLMRMADQRRTRREEKNLRSQQLQGQQKIASLKAKQDQQKATMDDLKRMHSEAIAILSMPEGLRKDQMIAAQTPLNGILATAIKTKLQPQDLEKALHSPYIQENYQELAKDVLQSIAFKRPMQTSDRELINVLKENDDWQKEENKLKHESTVFNKLWGKYQENPDNLSYGESHRLEKLLAERKKMQLSLTQSAADAKSAGIKADIGEATKPAEITKQFNEVAKQSADLEHTNVSTQHLVETIKREKLTQFDSVQDEHTFNALLKEAITMSRKPNAAPPDLTNIDPMAFLMTQSRYASVDDELLKKNLKLMSGAARGDVKNKLLALADEKPDPTTSNKKKTGQALVEEITKRHKK